MTISGGTEELSSPLISTQQAASDLLESPIVIIPPQAHSINYF
jgi:hypothetical protein